LIVRSCRKRLAKLSGGIGVIKVGAVTEVEMKEKKHRIEDAVAATKAAVEEGIVPGGGVALLRAQSVLAGVQAEGDEAIGVRLLSKAIEEPIRAIAQNAGKDGSVVVEAVKKMTGSEGYNALTDVYEDMLKAGIVDPAKVTRSALQNAALYCRDVFSPRSVSLPKSRRRKRLAVMATAEEWDMGY
jgi:chaperonin GroEL